MKTNRRNYLWLFIGAIVVSIGIPLLAYFLNFHSSSISSDPNDWASFGDYLGGTANTFLALVNLGVIILIALNLYELETQREKQLQGLVLRPFCEFIVTAHRDHLSISIKNFGNGPAQIQNIIFEEVKKTDVTPKAIDELIPEDEGIADVFGTVFDTVTCLGAGEEVNLLTINQKAENSRFNAFFQQVIENLSSVKIVLLYTDIFDVAMPEKRCNLASLRNLKPNS
ncbi:hypothetical protein ACQ4N7_30095 [Nodosilinea sp. AN01ver1]|uniref:hypothetical protein n=1 Tax=Nodosilinea sp. AN01ver1 TaxID=3423362 RepID=UPI003D31F5A1